LRPLYGAIEPSLVWRGGFYADSPGSGDWMLRLEYEGHDHTNRIKINGQMIGYLPSQTWADMWMSYALPVPAGLLREGYNELTVEVGRAIPDCQTPGNAWDELLFRRVRLERTEPAQTLAGAPAPVIASGGMPVTITVVIDNNAYRPGLETTWGFACLAQRGDRSILFDTGGDGRMLLSNMSALGLDPGGLDTVVLSHAHTDHTGGLDALLKANPDVTVYLPQAFPVDYKEKLRERGTQLVEVSSPLEIAPGVWSTGQMGSNIVEQALILQTRSGLAVITGCAHPGIVEMTRKAREVGNGEIDLVMGGFHLSAANTATIRQVASRLRELGVARVAPCHCTGADAAAQLATAFAEGYQRCGAGLVMQEAQ
jgi:7,8-dihydropterin-6-yl-methyl-4-(beta-D-ribofuranosyl)aminobenzene 5'-phosphate synthase